MMAVTGCPAKYDPHELSSQHQTLVKKNVQYINLVHGQH